MTRPLDQHLDGDELDALVRLQALGVTTSAYLSEEAIREAQRHVASCQDCDRKVQMHRSAQRQISQRAPSQEIARGPNCLGALDWVRVAAGVDGETTAKERMKHAAQCGHCGPLLKAAAKSLSGEITPDEEALLLKLGSANPNWQAEMAETLRRAGRPRRESVSSLTSLNRLLSWPRLVPAVAALLAVVAVYWVVLRVRAPKADLLLAQAYRDHRTIEVRIPAAGYAPLRVERSPLGSNLDKPEPLLKAEALIAVHLGQQPNDTVWLGAKARADLLDGNYDDSIKTLQRALESQPDSAPLLTDLGSAYFLRAKSTNQPIDYGNAVESLGKVLAKNPDDPIALFNRALTCEQMSLYTQAVDDWEHYLRIDSQGEWADEARRRLAAVNEKVRQHDRSMAEPLLSPAQIAFKIGDVRLKGEIDARVEEYLHAAITDWLPQAFGSRPEVSPNQSMTALLTLSKIMTEGHGDSWLADLLMQPHGRQFSKGVGSLSAAVRADDRGDYSRAHSFAQESARFFQKAANRAGEIRARGEEVYADHLLWEGQACISLLDQLDEPLKRTSYAWIQAQLSLEKSNCANLVGDLGTYQLAITLGIREAQAHHYLSLYLRGLGFEALSAASLGDTARSFALAAQGLSVFWSNHIDLTKGYNFYTDLDAAADGLNLPNLQVALWREATSLLDRDPDTVKRAMAHNWYGKAAYQSGKPDLAVSEFSKATRLFDASPQTPATARDRLDAEVWQAKAEVLQGDLDRASERLDVIESNLFNAPSFDPEIGYYTAASEIAIRRGDLAGTETAIRSAVFLSEWALNTFSTEDDRREWAEQTRDAYRYLVEWKLRQGDATAALELLEWYKGAEIRAVERGNLNPAPNLAIGAPPDPRNAPPLPSPTLVSTTLPTLRNKTLLSYSTFSDGTAVWAYDDRGIFSAWIATPSFRLRELATKLQRLCSDPNSDLIELRTTAFSLYGLLIHPIEEHLDPHRALVIEPDESLRVVPWDALVDESGHFLGQRFATVVIPGLYRMLHLRPPAEIGIHSTALIVSVPVAPGLPPLSDAENEAQSVAAMFSEPRLLIGQQATLSMIRKTLLGRTVFHFAGHAVASSQRYGLALAGIDPTSNSLSLIGPNSIPSRDVSDLQLAVLSACNTNANQSTDIATSSIGAGLLRAGVPYVITTRWKIDSLETANLMKIFYQSLLAGNKPATALREARIAIALRSTHPYFWSAFEFQGTT